jgi:hypothetical protein
MQQDSFTGWRKSRRSNSSGDCVEVGRAADGGVGVRDSKQEGRGPVQTSRADDWREILARGKPGPHDDGRPR